MCTANQCRSPFAEHIARRATGSRPLLVASAGFRAAGERVPSTGLRVAEQRGLALERHRSRRIDDVDLDSFDLILTMERQHARDIVAAHPALAPRVFTVKQFDRWAAAHPRGAGRALGPWLDEAAADRPPADLLGISTQDDTFDPIASPAPAWIAMADELEEHAAALVRWINSPGVGTRASRRASRG